MTDKMIRRDGTDPESNKFHEYIVSLGIVGSYLKDNPHLIKGLVEILEEWRGEHEQKETQND